MSVIKYQKAQIKIPKFLEAIWPYSLPLDAWPTFCGAGDSIGDWIIPENICGVDNSCCCFIHDIEWAIADKSFFAAMNANWVFYQNLRAITLSNYDKSKYSKGKVERGCLKYFIGTIIGAFVCFEPDGTKENPLQSPTVRSRLKKLAYVHYIPRRFYAI